MKTKGQLKTTLFLLKSGYRKQGTENKGAENNRKNKGTENKSAENNRKNSTRKNKGTENKPKKQGCRKQFKKWVQKITEKTKVQKTITNNLN